MHVTIFGLGYVGFTAACCIASAGHRVTGIDISDKKVAAINAGHSPIIEPQVDGMLTEGLHKGLIQADTVIGDHLSDSDLAIVCVGTPSAPDGSHNMGFIADVTRQIAAAIAPDRAKPLTVVYRSTIRPGTMDELIAPIFRSFLEDKTDDLVELVYNPEFLREGSAVKDYFAPPKI
ncbi:MAG: nucleotide sugar dehydrogenase, partial [Pseudomonadota bacterium]